MRVHSIFTSIDGEVNKWGQGTFSTFLRLAGCGLACTYCDTPQARDWDGKKVFTLSEVINEINKRGCKKVTITGGEPLMQQDALFNLLRYLLFRHPYDKRDFKVSIETNGSIPIPEWGGGINWIADYKLPSSGMSEQMDLENFENLGSDDYIKMVVEDKNDFYFALGVIDALKEKRISARIAMSPLDPTLPPGVLMGWLMKEKMFDIQLNVQLHKLLGIE